MEERRVSFTKRWSSFKDRCLRLACCYGNQSRTLDEESDINMNFRRDFDSKLEELIHCTLNDDVERFRAITVGKRLSKFAVGKFFEKRDLLVDEFDESVIEPELFLLGHEILDEDESVYSFKASVGDVVLEMSRSSKLSRQINDLLPRGATTSLSQSYDISDYTDSDYSDSLRSGSSILTPDDSDLDCLFSTVTKPQCRIPMHEMKGREDDSSLDEPGMLSMFFAD